MTAAHQRIEELIAMNAIGAIPADESVDAEREILDHVTGCSPCRTLYRTTRETAGDLALAAPPRAVPPELEQKILARIRGEMPVIRQERSRMSMRLLSVAAAFMILTVGSLSAFAASLSSRLGREERKTVGVTRALELVGRSGTKTARLAGPGGTMVLAYAANGEAMLVGTSIKAPPSDHVLELWLIRDGVPAAIGAFRPIDGIVSVPVKVDPGTHDTLAVTVERSFVKVPTTKPISAVVIT